MKTRLPRTFTLLFAIALIGCSGKDEPSASDMGSTPANNDIGVTSDAANSNSNSNTTPDAGSNQPGVDAGGDQGTDPQMDASADMRSNPDMAPPPIGGVFPGIPEYPFRDQLPPLDAPADVTSCDGNGMTVNGTPDDWVVVTFDQDSRCQIDGSYFVVQNSTLNHRLNASGGPYAIRNNDVNSPGTGGAVNTGGTQILVEGNTIHDNGEIPSSADHHGMNVPGNTDGLWILSNLMFENSGDSIQFCHNCVGGAHDGPENVYIAGNVLHDDEENAIDLKEFVGPVVVVCNEMYGYEVGQFSGNGEAVRINDEGQQGQVWFSKNQYSDNVTDVAPYNSDAEGYFLDENTTNINNNNSNTIFADGADAQQYYDQYMTEYGLDLSAPCP